MSELSDSPSSRRRALQPSAGQFKRVITITLRDRLISTLVVHWPVPWSFSSRARQETQGQAGQDRNMRRCLVQMSDFGHNEGGPGRSSVGRRADSRSCWTILNPARAHLPSGQSSRSKTKRAPRLMAVMLEMIADKSLAQEWRMDILGRIKETAPTLSRAGRGSPKFLRPRVLLRIQRYCL